MFSICRRFKRWKSSKSVIVSLILAACALLGSCSSSKHVPDGSLLLDKVDIRVDSTAHGERLDATELQSYLRQAPNHKMLWSIKFRLGFYNMSGNDSTNWWNRWMRKLGEAPVIYDPELAEASAAQLSQFLANKGFFNSSVGIDSVVDHDKKKIALTYHLSPGQKKIITDVLYEFPDSLVEKIVMADSAKFVVAPGVPLSRDALDTQRTVVTDALRNAGYYHFSKEYVTFVADTTEGSPDVELLMKVSAPPGRPDTRAAESYSRYVLRKVTVIADADAIERDRPEESQIADSVHYHGLEIIYGDSRYLRPSVVADNCYLTPGALFSQKDVDRTYRAFTRLEILKFINITFVPAGHIADEGLLDAYVMLTPGKSQTASVELEGTNSEGDLGVAVGLTYSHRNIGKGSETFTAKARGSYESLSGNLEGLLNNRYMEYSLDLGLSMPQFKAPISRHIRRKIQASTEVNFSMNYQERPEYTRVISTAGWSYKWVDSRKNNRHTFTPIDINYVYLPASTNDFINQIAPDNPLLRYSYEDHFIMRMGWRWYHSNKRQVMPWMKTMQRNIYNVRFNAEIAGNLLFALSSIFAHRSNFHQDPYRIFGIHYSQYFKLEADYAFLHRFDERNSLALRAGLGVGVPYGNSEVLPFEKRFYGGGANGVRGWDVRTLGPGAYPGKNSVSDFINQCGDVRIITSAEYRAKLFWVIELGTFVDIGNIWTIRDYPYQQGGVFRFNEFYKQLAAAYGLGIRLDFDYFLVRLDVGMKAHNPAMGARPWPLVAPNWHRDSSFHFSIGYPF